MTCVCNDTHRVLADRDKRTVEAACGRCTPVLVAALTARVEALERAFAQLAPNTAQELEVG